jgi:hypothetical protein
MGKGPDWSDADTVQLCYSWLETSEDRLRGAGQKKETFYGKIYQHWLQNKSAESEDRSVAAIAGRWKKLLPEVTKFEGIFSKLKRRECSGWNEAMYIANAAKIYNKRHKQPSEFKAAWEVIRDKPKWTSKLTTASIITNKRKADDEPAVSRPGGQKAAKRNSKQSATAMRPDVHLRFVVAVETKAAVMEQQLQFNIFMQDPECEESKEVFALQRKQILAKVREKAVSGEGNKQREEQEEDEAVTITRIRHTKRQTTNWTQQTPKMNRVALETTTLIFNLLFGFS